VSNNFILKFFSGVDVAYLQKNTETVKIQRFEKL